MSELSPQPSYELEDWEHRTTHYGLNLVYRRDPASGEESTVAFDESGVTEIVSKDSRAHNAYLHPSVTPGLEAVHQNNPWDEALDAYNSLDQEAQAWAMQAFERVRAGGAAAPTILFDAVRRQRRQLDKAA